MRMMDLTNMLQPDSGWRKLSRRSEHYETIYPNEAWSYKTPEGATVGALVLRRSLRGEDFSMKRDALNFMVSKVGRTLREAYVALAEPDSTVIVGYTTAKKVALIFKDVPTIYGDKGNYWWVNHEFHIASYPEPF